MIRQYLSSAVRLSCSLVLILCLLVAAFADTIRLRDGSVIRGEVVSFGDGQFTVLIGSGARGRRSRITLYTDDVESIEFGDNSSPANNTPSISSGNPTTNTRSSSNSGDAPPRTAQNTGASEPSSAAVPSASSSPAARTSVFDQAIVRVRADNTTNGWTNSGITVRRGQRLRISATGRVTLGENRISTPAGVSTINDPGKLMRDEATGALIAVIGDNNDDFIFIGARREFTAQRDGVLFLGVNEGNLNDNTGIYEATVSYEAR